MADRLLCPRLYSLHPVTGALEPFKATEGTHYEPCSVCGAVVAASGEPPSGEYVCVEHLDDDEWPTWIDEDGKPRNDASNTPPSPASPSLRGTTKESRDE